MKPHALNLLIVDGNRVITDPLSNYLNTRFGLRINILNFFDAEHCILKIDELSHVIVLDYFSETHGKKTRNGLEIFNSIKTKSPNTQITMITSSGDIPDATIEMQRGASNYIIRRERYLRKILRLMHSGVIQPIHKAIVLPIQKIISEYTLRDYLTMFIVAFASVGVLVYLFLKMFP